MKAATPAHLPLKSYEAFMRFFYRFISLFILTLIFLEANGITPVAEFSANNQAICVGGSTTFTNTSTGTINTYSWNFGSGASPATANTAGPHLVTYSTTGSKTVTLTVNGPDGNSVNTKTNYINVGSQRIKIMSYNLLNYTDLSTSDTTIRNPYFRTILAATDPDILVVQEVTSLSSMNVFLSNVLNANGNTYTRGTFINGFDTDNGIFYKTSKFSLISNTPIETALRDINEFRLSNTLTGDEIRIYSVHLKASSGGTNEDARAAEVDSLRKVTNALPAGTNFIVCGDFNIYGSTESAYIKLKQNNPGDDGHFIDPINITGTWNNLNYAIYHTQCTRDTALGTGGASGGMNDRFDMMLYSSAVSQTGGVTYVSGSTTAYGNDGNHYEQSIYISPNTAVSQTIATALYNASDHLPIIASFDFALNNCQSVDLGPTMLVSPASPTCASLNRTIQVRVKNFGLNAINFSQNSATVNVQITTPSSAVLNFSKTISSGSLSAGDSLLVTLDSTLAMSTQGDYFFDISTTYLPDVNISNNDLATVTVTTSSAVISTISPPGPLTICSGTSVVLTAGTGTSYQWSTGATSQSISVSSQGSYSVSYLNQSGCLTNATPVSVSLTSFQSAYTVMSENMGNVGTTTTIATHESTNGFQNINLTMSGTGDIRSTTPSVNYVTVSGGANVFLTTIPGRNFLISGINTSTANNITLSFGLHKSTTASNGSDLLVSYSTDGTTFIPLSFPALATGTGTAVWQYITINEQIPSTPNLRIQFTQNGSTTQFRIDDVLLSGFDSALSITPQGPTTFCSGGSVTLNSSYANHYLWSTGATTQSITVSSSGNYTVTGTSGNGCTTTSAPVAVNANACATTVNLTVFIEGLYNGNGTMKTVTALGQPGVCDTITLELADISGAHAVLHQNKALLQTNGNAQFTFPPGVTGNSYYFVVKHRNSLESWSSSPILINSSTFSYQFNDVQGKVLGNNQKNLNDGNYALLSGDVDQNGLINLTDLNLLTQQIQLFNSGYLPADLNGDSIIESSDFSLIENNLLKSVVRP